MKMKRARQGLVFSLLLLLAISSAPAHSAEFPDVVEYSGRILAGDGQYAAELRLYPEGSDELLYSERQTLTVEGGRFDLTLGKATPDAGGFERLDSLFSQYPRVQLEVVVAGVVQEPRVGILPAGHSQASMAALSGATRPGAHWKGFEVVGTMTATQAVQLQPQGTAQASASDDVRRNPFEVPVFFLGESVPVSELPIIDASDAPAFHDNEVNPPRHESIFDEKGNRFGTTTRKVVDSLAAYSIGGGSTPDPILNFEGVDNVNGVLPPDTEGAVGPSHYVQVVNLAFSIFDKTGTLLTGPSNTNTLWAGFGGPCQSNNSGDAIFIYDQFVDRWILSQFAVSGAQSVCFAVSTTSDPLGTYFLYELVAQRFPDYYKLGLWPDPSNNAIFLTTNSGFQNGYDVYAVDRANLLAGIPPRPAQFFQSFFNLFMPADVDGALGPPPGSPGILYTFRDGGESYFGNPPTDSLDIYEFDVDWDNANNSTFGPAQSIVPPDLAEFNWTVCGFFGQNCLPQPGTGATLDSASWWPMQRLVYRNFGTHETLVGAWTVDLTGTPDHAAPRWFELRRSLAALGSDDWDVHQQGTWAPDSDHRFMPSIGMDGDGNIGMGYSVVSSTTFPSIRYAVRAEGDAPGTLRTEASLIEGTGVQTSGSSRWGDYASIDIDPVDDCTFWFTTEYIETTGGAPWQTRVGTFQVPGCGGLSVMPSSKEVCSADGTTSFAVELFDQFQTTTDMTITGCPAGATCGYTPNPVVFPTTTASLDISGLGALAAGNYPMIVVATENGVPSNTRDVPIELNIVDITPGAPVLTAPTNGATDTSPTPLLTWMAGAQVTDYFVEVATDAAFTMVVESATVTGTSYQVQTTLGSATTYYWRVSAANACGTSANSAVFSFTTETAPGECSPGSVPLITFEDDLESGATGWTTGGTASTWQLSGAQTNSGSNAFWGEDIDSISDQHLITPPMDIPSSGNATFQYYSWKDIEENGASACYDGGVLEISTNGGSSWTRLEGELDTDPYYGTISTTFSNPLGGENAWCGSAGWLKSVVDVNAWQGETAQFRFRLATDSSVDAEGWYIDDVKLQSCGAGEIFADGFESGDVSAWSVSTP